MQIVAFSDRLLEFRTRLLKFFYAISWLDSLFLFSTELHFIIPLSGCSTVCLSIHLVKDIFLGCTQGLAIMNKSSINSYVQFLYRLTFSALLGKYQGEQLLDHMVSICLVS